MHERIFVPRIRLASPTSVTIGTCHPARSPRSSTETTSCVVDLNSQHTEIRYAPWWMQNNMYQYALRPDSSTETDCLDNALLLRKDVHHIWDAHWFSIVPKKDVWVVHVLDFGRTTELIDCYHNRELLPLYAIARELLLARFALAVLDKKSIVVKQGVPRRLVVVEEDGGQQMQEATAEGTFATLWYRLSKSFLVAELNYRSDYGMSCAKKPALVCTSSESGPRRFAH